MLKLYNSAKRYRDENHGLYLTAMLRERESFALLLVVFYLEYLPYILLDRQDMVTLN